jgi:glutamyl-tRNA reductase
LFDIDDLKLRVERNREDRLREGEKAEQMVVEEVGVLRQWFQSLEVTPTIVALRNRVDDIKRAEVEKALGRLSHLSDRERELVESMASTIVNKLIHSTLVTLKTEVNSSEGAAFVEAARRFFNLGESSSSIQNGLSTSSCSESDHGGADDESRVEGVTPPSVVRNPRQAGS